MDATDQSPEHLTEQELASFLDRELSTDDHRRVAAHLNGCAECRTDMSRASAALGRHRSRRRMVAGLVPLAAAAVIAAVLLVPDSALRPRGDPSIVRGGGEGKASGGHPRSPWGQPAKGYKTRKKNKHSNKYIVRRRGKKRR